MRLGANNEESRVISLQKFLTMVATQFSISKSEPKCNPAPQFFHNALDLIISMPAWRLRLTCWQTARSVAARKPRNFTANKCMFEQPAIHGMWSQFHQISKYDQPCFAVTSFLTRAEPKERGNQFKARSSHLHQISWTWS